MTPATSGRPGGTTQRATHPAPRATGGLIAAGFIFVPLLTILYLIMIRISTEFVIVAFRTYEEVKHLRADME